MAPRLIKEINNDHYLDTVTQKMQETKSLGAAVKEAAESARDALKSAWNSASSFFSPSPPILPAGPNYDHHGRQGYTKLM